MYLINSNSLNSLKSLLHREEVTFAEIEENEFNLNIARYVQKPLEQETITLEQALSDFTTKMADLEKAEQELETLLKAQGFKIKDAG